MKVLFVEPSRLLASEGRPSAPSPRLERAAAGAREEGHQARALDLRIFTHREFLRQLTDWRPDVVWFLLDPLANVPEIVGLSQAARDVRPACFVFCEGRGGADSAADELVQRSRGAISCVLGGDDARSSSRLLAAVAARRRPSPAAALSSR